MKRINAKQFLLLLIIIIIVALTACDYGEQLPNLSEEITTDDISNDPPTMQAESNKNKVYGNSWDEFHQNIHSANLNTINPTSYEIFDLSVDEIEGYTIRSVSVVEYLNDPSKEDWDLIIYWDKAHVPQSSQTEIRAHVFKMSELVSVGAATKGYTLIDEENRVYQKDFGTGKIGVVCLINDNMFTRIVIPKNCENFDEIRDRILQYIFQIRELSSGTA